MRLVPTSSAILSQEKIAKDRDKFNQLEMAYPLNAGSSCRISILALRKSATNRYDMWAQYWNSGSWYYIHRFSCRSAFYHRYPNAHANLRLASDARNEIRVCSTSADFGLDGHAFEICETCNFPRQLTIIYARENSHEWPSSFPSNRDETTTDTHWLSAKKPTIKRKYGLSAARPHWFVSCRRWRSNSR